MSTVAPPLTYDDLLRMPDDGKRYELIDGELIEMTSPEAIHQRLLGRLFRVLDDFVTDRDLGEVFVAPLDVRFAPPNTVQPDLVYLSYARFGVVESRPIDGVPDLIVEILSPSTREYDEGRKAQLYERFGVPEYWLVDAEQRAIRGKALVDGRYEPMTQEGDVFRSRLLAGLVIEVGSLFAPPRRRRR